MVTEALRDASARGTYNASADLLEHRATMRREAASMKRAVGRPRRAV